MELSLASLRKCGAPGVRDDELWSGGEDHALVGTVPPALVEQLPPGVRLVGRVVAGAGEVRVDGELVRGGWDHFSEDSSSSD
jgi:thiamine monophosphate kinase